MAPSGKSGRKRVAVVGDSPGGNYVAKVMALQADLEPGEEVYVTVTHDDWCAMLVSGQPCNCDPTVERESDRPN